MTIRRFSAGCLVCAGLLAASLSLVSCPNSMDLPSYLDYSTNDARVLSADLSSFPTDSAGVHCVPSDSIKTISLKLRNINGYSVNPVLKFTGSAAQSAAVSTEGVFVNQSSATNLDITLSRDFLMAMDKGGDISFYVMMSADNGRSFPSSAAYNIYSNTPPPDIEGAVIEYNLTSQKYIICFNLPDIASDRISVQQDIVSIKINDTSYALSLNSDGSYTLADSFVTSAPSELTAVTGEGTFTAGTHPVYFQTEDTLNANADTSYQLSIVDSAGLSSSAVTVETGPNAAKYALTYDGNGATSGTVPVDSTRHKVGVSVSVLGNTGSLARPGYKLLGWSTDASASTAAYAADGSAVISMPNGNTTLYAIWSDTFTITYNNMDGATNSSDNPASYKSTDAAVALYSPSRSGWHFHGWYTAADFSGSAVSSLATGSSSADYVLYARWAKFYTVAYNGNGNTGGSVPSDTGEYEEGETVTVKSNSGSLARTDCAFEGWSETSGASAVQYAAGSSLTMGTADINLYAVWYGTASITITMPSYSEIGTITDDDSTSGQHKFSL